MWRTRTPDHIALSFACLARLKRAAIFQELDDVVPQKHVRFDIPKNDGGSTLPGAVVLDRPASIFSTAVSGIP